MQEECTAKGLDCAAIVAERTRYDARLYARALGLWSVARAAHVGTEYLLRPHAGHTGWLSVPPPRRAVCAPFVPCPVPPSSF